MRAIPWLLAVLLATGCSKGGKSSTDAGVAVDLGGGIVDQGPVDLAWDMTLPTACNPVDDNSDGQLCGKTACPANQVPVEVGGACHCYGRCSSDVQCPCDRLCDAITAADGGAAGGACLPGNSAGTRCGQDATTHALFGAGICAQGLACVDSDATHRYCAYACSGAGDCPAQTSCDKLTNGSSACGLLPGTVAFGTACTPNSADCATGLLCDGAASSPICRNQCDGPGATCTSGGTCTLLADGSKVIGYICK